MAATRLWMLSCFAAGALLAQPTLRITSPADKTVVRPGQSFRVKVEATGRFIHVIVIGGDPIGSSVPLSTPPYEFTIKIPENISETRYPLTYPLTADGCTSPGNCVNSKPIHIVVEFPGPQIRLKVQPSLLRLSGGGKGSLKVLGVLPDVKLWTSRRPCRSHSRRTRRRSSGIVSALAPGPAKITVTYRDSHVDVPVTVVAKQP